MSQLHGLEVTRWSVREGLTGFFNAGAKHLPRKLAETRVEALVIDTIHAFLELVPMSLGMPYAHVWNVLHVDLSGSTPPCFFSWPYESTPEARVRNRNGVETAAEMFAPLIPLAMSYADKMRLDIDWSDFAATTSNLAVVTQMPKEFDFPGSLACSVSLHRSLSRHRRERAGSFSLGEAQWQAIGLRFDGDAREWAGERVPNPSSGSGAASGDSGCAFGR